MRHRSGEDCDAPDAPLGHTELVPLGMTAGERLALEAFLNTLSADNPANATAD